MEKFVNSIVIDPFQGTQAPPRRGKWNFWVPAVSRNRISVDVKSANRVRTIKFIIDEHDNVHFTTPDGIIFDSFGVFLRSEGLRFEDWEGYCEDTIGN